MLAAYRARDGSRLWHVQGERGRLWVLDQGLYAAVARQGLDALDPVSGAVRWRYRPGDDVSLATAAAGILYGVSVHSAAGLSQSQAIVALAVRDGMLLWRFPIGTRVELPVVG